MKLCDVNTKTFQNALTTLYLLDFFLIFLYGSIGFANYF